MHLTVLIPFIIIFFLFFYFCNESFAAPVNKNMQVKSEVKSEIKSEKTSIKKRNIKKLYKDVDDGFPEIVLPQDAPWDEKIDYCYNNKGTIDNIDFDQTLLDYQPKRIIF
jgi:hypothetical protein